jgi:hypothetical protein
MRKKGACSSPISMMTSIYRLDVGNCDIRAEQKNEMKWSFGLDWKFEFKKSFKLYGKTLVSFIMKDAKKLSISHDMDESKWN